MAVTTRIYLLPQVGTGTSTDDAFRPKYVVNSACQPLVSGSIAFHPYGQQGTSLVFAQVTPAEHTALVANPDVVALPANLDNQVGAVNLATVIANLEALGFPADSVVASTTYRTIVRRALRFIILARKIDQLGGGRMLPQGLTLNSLVGDLTAGQQQKLTAAIESLGGTTAGITGGQTLRSALLTLSGQFPYLSRVLDLDL